MQRRTDNTMTNRTNNNLQGTTQKTNDRALRIGMNACAPRGLLVPLPLVTHTRRVSVKRREHHRELKLEIVIDTKNKVNKLHSISKT